jgi:hypothetical protein
MGLWIYTIKYVSQDFKDYYQNSKILDLNDNQYEIIWYVISRDKNYGFKWQPFIFDIIFEDKNEFTSRRNVVDLITAETIISQFGYRDLNNAHIRYYALTRYINFDNNWKKCLSIIVQNHVYGNNITNIIDASGYYYNKSIKDLSDMELMALLSPNPICTIGNQEELDNFIGELFD